MHHGASNGIANGVRTSNTIANIASIAVAFIKSVACTDSCAHAIPIAVANRGSNASANIPPSPTADLDPDSRSNFGAHAPSHA